MNFEPLIDAIARMIGSDAKLGEVGKAAEGTGRGVLKGGTAHSRADVERWLGPLSEPQRQVPMIHDYLRGHSALAEAEATGATHVRDISVPVWQAAQQHLQAKVDTDPEVQLALKNLFIGRNTPKDPDVTTSLVRGPEAPLPAAQSIEVPEDVNPTPARPVRPRPSLDAEARKQQAAAWNEFAIATESQDPPRIDAALERIKGLHDSEVPGKPAEVPPWQRALNYMAELEQQTQAWRAARMPNEAWSQSVAQHKALSGIDQVMLPKHIRDVVERFEAWADAQKPATTEDRITQALGVPRAVMSSADLSAPGRQGLLMMARPEYWQNLGPMVQALDPAKYLESQAYIRNHPDFGAAAEAGLAITDIHSKLLPREEAFQSQMAERLPVIGPVVKASEQAYTTFLNRLRFDVFSNTLKEATAAGVNVRDTEFTRSLAEWINTSTGRGGGKFNPGPLSTILFSPRLAIARFQTFNPWYYYKLHPFVRQQALKANLAASAAVYGLVSLAALGGARVTWDFRNPDAGKIRIGNTRLDLGGGHFQFLRLFTQIATRQKVNSETGAVSNLGEKFGAPTALDLVTNFIVAKEAPIASFVTDWLRGKDQGGNKFNLSNEVISRMVPLAMQDMYDLLKDKGVEGLLFAFPALVGIGMQTYAAKPSKEYVPFLGVRGEVPVEQSAEYAKLIEQADTTAATLAAQKTKNMGPMAARAVLRNYVRAERLKARIVWIKTNRDAFVKARLAGEKVTPLTAPQPQEQP